MKRIVLFVLTNLAVLLVLSVVAQVTGLDRWLALHGASLGGLLTFAALFGFGGALISLALSKVMAKRAMGVQLIGPGADPTSQFLLGVVQQHAQRLGIGMPEVGIFPATEPNAFATGASRNHALVAVSSGLLQRMNHEEIEAVLGHEMSHVANGDMVTLTLLQGVLNTFVIFLSRLIGGVVDRSEDGRGGGYFLTVIVLQLVLGFLASLIVLWFSRSREFRADRGGAHLAGRDKMIAALEELRRGHEPLPAQQFAAFGIAAGQAGGGLRRLLMSHPPLEERIAALRSLSVV